MPRLPLVVIAALFSVQVFAAAVVESDVSARAQGMAGAVAADSDDIHAIFYNPAGLRFLSAPDNTIGQIALHGAREGLPAELSERDKPEISGLIGGGGRGHFSFALGIYSTGTTPLLSINDEAEKMSLDRMEWAAAGAWHNDWLSLGATLAVVDLSSADDDNIESSEYGLTLGALVSPINRYVDLFNSSFNYQLHLAAVGKTETEVKPFEDLPRKQRSKMSVVARPQTLSLGVNQQIAWMTGFGAFSLGVNAELEQQKYSQLNGYAIQSRSLDIQRQATSAELKLAANGGPTLILRAGLAQQQDDNKIWIDQTRESVGLGVHGTQWGLDLAFSRIDSAREPGEERESFSATISSTW